MIIYASRTGNSKSVVEKLQLPARPIEQAQPVQPFLLFTYTDGLGSVPTCVEQFMKQYHTLCRGIIVTGNRNFGELFGRAGDILATRFQLPLVAKLDLRGTTADYEKISLFYHSIWKEAST